MDCRTFRKQHVAFVDDTLPGVALVPMQRHLHVCSECAQLDADVRYGLLLFRNNLPTIEPSATFATRLNVRLEHERRRALVPVPLFRGPGLSSFLAMSMSVVAVGFLAMALGELPRNQGIARLPAVVLRPDNPSLASDSDTVLPVTPSALVASVSTGMAVWPALLLLEEAPARFANEAENATPALRAVNYSPGRDLR